MTAAAPPTTITTTEYVSFVVVFVTAPLVVRWLMLAAYRARVRVLMRQSAASPEGGRHPTPSEARQRPAGLRAEALLNALERRRRSLLVVYAAAIASQVLLSAWLFLSYVEPGRISPLALLAAIGLNAGQVLPLLWRMLRDNPLARGGVWPVALLFGLPQGASVWVGLSLLAERATIIMVLLVAVQTLVLGGVTFALALAALRALRWLAGHLSPDLLTRALLALAAAAFGALVAGIYGNVRALALLATPLAYLIVATLGPRHVASRPLVEPPLQLLVLRAFRSGSGARTLLRTLARRWSALGPVCWIAAPDVAHESVDASSLTAFLTGRLRQRFLGSRQDLDRALTPRRRYGDGSHPVAELACFDNLWREAVDRLITRSHVIIIDLRGLSRAHQGCADELGLLARRGALSRLVVLVDRTTDRPALAVIMQGVGVGEASFGRLLDTDQAKGDAIVRALVEVAAAGNT